MKIKFIDDGGFNKVGAFIEYEGEAPTGDELHYERQSYITIDMTCHELRLNASYAVCNEEEEQKDRSQKSTSTITGIGEIGKANRPLWGEFSLSFLGTKTEHRKVDVVIRRNELGEAVSMAGFSASSDLDTEVEESFFIQVELASDRFDQLLSQLKQADAILHMRVKTAAFPNFYATWSPSISEGRIIKFLDRPQDVENRDRIPEEFWVKDVRKKWLMSSEDPPVSLNVQLPIR